MVICDWWFQVRAGDDGGASLIWQPGGDDAHLPGRGPVDGVRLISFQVQKDIRSCLGLENTVVVPWRSSGETVDQSLQEV